MRHMWAYYTRDPAKPIELYRPFPNSNCTQCHSTTLEKWQEDAEHKAVLEDIKKGETSCVAAGCHGPVHPFSKKAEGKQP
jgi:hypothetical protein